MAKKKAAQSSLVSLPSGRLRFRKDPRSFAVEAAVPAASFFRVVGLDLGSRCGFAFCDILKDADDETGNVIVCGVWDLSVGPYESGALRHIRFINFLQVTQPDLVVFEDVKFTPSAELFRNKSPAAIIARAATASEFIGGLKASLLVWADKNIIPCQPVGITEIKAHATGSGKANKLRMVQSANEKFGLNLPANSEEEVRASGDDNIADALFCCDIGVTRYVGGLERRWPSPAIARRIQS